MNKEIYEKLINTVLEDCDDRVTCSCCKYFFDESYIKCIAKRDPEITVCPTTAEFKDMLNPEIKPTSNNNFPEGGC